MRVLLLKESPVWVAQCLEHDIAAQGATAAGAKDAFVRAFAAQIAVLESRGRGSAVDFEEAPRYYWDLFGSAHRLADPLRVPDSVAVPPAYMVNAAQNVLADAWISG